VAVLALGVAVGLSACGGSGPKREHTKADQRLAANVGFRASDFPPDWRADRTARTGGRSGKCYDAAFSRLVITGEAREEFSEPVTYASSSVIVFKTRAMADSALARAEMDKVIRCLSADLTPHVMTGVEVENTSISQPQSPKLGEHSAAYEAKIDFGRNSVPPTGYVDVVLIKRSRVLSLLLFGEIVYPFDPGLRARLSRTIAVRMTPS
jgi:hypothetical protein